MSSCTGFTCTAWPQNKWCVAVWGRPPALWLHYSGKGEHVTLLECTAGFKGCCLVLESRYTGSNCELSDVLADITVTLFAVYTTCRYVQHYHSFRDMFLSSWRLWIKHALLSLSLSQIQRVTSNSPVAKRFSMCWYVRGEELVLNGPHSWEWPWKQRQ